MKCKRCEKEIPDGSVFCPLCGRKQIAERKQRRRANGEGSVYRERGRYTAEITTGWNYSNGRRIVKKKRGFSTKAAAYNYIPILIKEAQSANQSLKENSTFNRFFAQWSAVWGVGNNRLSVSRQGAYRTAFKKLADIADIPIADITIEMLQNIVDKKASTYYPARDMRTVISNLYERACAQGCVPANLAQFIALPELNETETRPFTTEEQRKLWSAWENGDKFTGYIILMMYSGMMPGELFICRKSMIHWQKQCIIGCGIKTKKRRKTPIVIADFLLPILKSVCTISDTDKLVGMSEQKWYKEFHAALERAGCAPNRPYACRHTYANEIEMNTKAPDSVKRELMRQKTESSRRHYLHPDIADALNTANQLVPNGDAPHKMGVAGGVVEVDFRK